MLKKNTIFNDPIYGFITIESDLILQLINHPYFQRLRRISQMGLSVLVYPGAHHSRFEHAIGAMHVMQKVINVLKRKNIKISNHESEALQIAILLHDIGHGPFSHATENIILKGVDHEYISLKIIEKLNDIFEKKLALALKIIKNEYHRKFMYQLISGQIDVDRLDFLKRDSFYTGVTEGNINSERIITMMDVKNENLVFEYKSIHSIEKFLLARRLMYWQVYLHKTSLVAELLLVKILERYRELINSKKQKIDTNHPLELLMYDNVNENFNKVLLNKYLKLEDLDIFYLIKIMRKSSDNVLRKLCNQIIDRKLPKIQVQEIPFSDKDVSTIKKDFYNKYPNLDLNFFVYTGNISNQMYKTEHSQILIKTKTGEIIPLSNTIDYLDFDHFSKPIFQHYLCYPKE